MYIFKLLLMFLLTPKIAAVSLAVPLGNKPIAGLMGDFITPFKTSLAVPSPPATKKTS